MKMQIICSFQGARSSAPPGERKRTTGGGSSPNASVRLVLGLSVLEGCDAILALGESLSYHAPTDEAEARLQRFFDGAGRALSPGGLLVLDLIETGEPPLDGRAWKTCPDWAVLSASNEDAERKRVTRHIETFREVGGAGYRRRCELHAVRLFDREAVCAWLAQAGFVVETRFSYGAFALPRRRVAFYATRR